MTPADRIRTSLISTIKRKGGIKMPKIEFTCDELFRLEQVVSIGLEKYDDMLRKNMTDHNKRFASRDDLSSAERTREDILLRCIALDDRHISECIRLLSKIRAEQ